MNRRTGLVVVEPVGAHAPIRSANCSRRKLAITVSPKMLCVCEVIASNKTVLKSRQEVNRPETLRKYAI
jgi:hypothetical protein